MTLNNPTQHLRDYLSIQGVILPDNIFRTDEKPVTSSLNVNAPMETI